ncbi:hypothetical protein SAMN04489729_7730 [Amycolatopsis lurida]|uniref:hypothetical protein n=1 Tax=Amycolatopsis lurida TaxID=31959 RepID=UPI000898B87B|nr:hypothetical protein [Amycolatopsis lurida]SEE48547.1 hypothetical protein SAMN04489729_7730 [Amycolatopsis lurida]
MAESFVAPTIHEEVATPLIGKLSILEQRATAWTVFWMAYFVVCRIVSEDPRFEVLSPLSLAAFYGIPACLYAAWLWKSRRRSASKTGLREATATVRPGWLYPRIDVYLERDYKLLQTRRSLRIAPRFEGLEKVPVFVGGEGTDMIVIFPRGRFTKDTLYAVPVKEIEPDTR